VSKVLFFNGAGEQVADIFQGMCPDGFDVAWKPAKIGDDEKIAAAREADFIVLHPAKLSGGVVREAKSCGLSSSSPPATTR
jgi:hypothetical protein